MEPYVDSPPVQDYLPWSRGPGGNSKVGTTFMLWVLLVSGITFGGRRAIPWAVAAGVFAILSLGPALKLDPAPSGPPGTGTLMPFYFLYEFVPLFHRFQFPSRMFAFALPGAALTASMAISSWPRPGKSPMWTILPVALVAVLVLELLFTWPLRPGDRPEVHEFYSSLPADGDNYGIIEIPFNFTTIDSAYQYNQTRHQAHIFNGTFAPFFDQDPTGGLVSGNLLMLKVRELQHPLFERNRHIPPPAIPPELPPRQETMEEALKELADSGFRFVLVHREVTASMRKVRFDSLALEEFLTGLLGPPILRDDDLSVFQIPGGES